MITQSVSFMCVARVRPGPVSGDHLVQSQSVQEKCRTKSRLSPAHGWPHAHTCATILFMQLKAFDTVMKATATAQSEQTPHLRMKRSSKVLPRRLYDIFESDFASNTI
jgi:hypothetical protein